MRIALRTFCEDDVPLKVKWINDPQNNTYLHYDMPLEEEATRQWFSRVKDLPSRLDMTILADDKPVGIIGLLGIDKKVKQAELYITIGERNCKGKGVAGRAMEQLARLAFDPIGLERIFLFTETQNIAAVRCYQKFGMSCSGVLQGGILNREGELVDRYVFFISKQEFEGKYGKVENNTNL